MASDTGIEFRPLSCIVFYGNVPVTDAKPHARIWYLVSAPLSVNAGHRQKDDLELPIQRTSWRQHQPDAAEEFSSVTSQLA